MSQNQSLNNNVSNPSLARPAEVPCQSQKNAGHGPQTSLSREEKSALVSSQDPRCTVNDQKMPANEAAQSKGQLQAEQKKKKGNNEKSAPNRNIELSGEGQHRVFRNGDMIINVKKNIQYRAIEMIGQGTFGQVLSVVSTTKSSTGLPAHHKMALKIIKSQPAYINQGLMEIKNLQQIAKYEQKVGASKSHLKLYDGFMWEGHLCIAMELMDNSILDILQTSAYKGIEMKWIQKWAREILLSLAKIHKIGIIHCDIKPENIMFRPEQPQKPILIDFSSSCTVGSQMFTYIQSRFYRSPQVLIGVRPYTDKIDIWSLGCVLAEMYLGFPIFPGGSAYDQIAKLYKIVGSTLNDEAYEFISKSELGTEFFIIEQEKNKNIPGDTLQQQIKQEHFIRARGNQQIKQLEVASPVKIRLKTCKQYRKAKIEKIQLNQEYFNLENLDEMISIRNPAPKDLQTHELFVDLVKKMLDFNPESRISAEQAFLHPFISGTFSQLEVVRNIEDMLEEQKSKGQGKQ